MTVGLFSDDALRATAASDDDERWERARPSFFITTQRMGIDFGLLSADSRPLTAKQLTAILGQDASFGDRRGADQDAVDARLFGLGRERYTQLLDLLIALRRPLLVKDLDPVKVSAILSVGLSPVDEDLVEQAAWDFENPAAVRSRTTTWPPPTRPSAPSSPSTPPTSAQHPAPGRPGHGPDERRRRARRSHHHCGPRSRSGRTAGTRGPGKPGSR